MKKNLCIFVLFVAMAVKAETYKIEAIESLDLASESKVFTAFKSVFAEESKAMAEQSFDDEEQIYNQKLEEQLFFHALLGDQVIGYISCDLISKHHVVVRQWAIDPSVFDVSIIKDLLLAVLQKIGKIQTLRISCPVGSKELTAFFQDLGFTLVEKLSDLKNIIFEFKRSSKCKLCDLVYGNIFQEEDDKDLDDQEGSADLIVVPALELSMSDVDYN